MVRAVRANFARRLGAAAGLEVVHLDRHYWNPNWVETPKDEWQTKVAEILAGDSWIIDGNYSGTLEMRIERCDTVIFLDMPRIVCVYRILRRVVIYHKVTRPDMGMGCGEQFNWKFIKSVWNYPTRSKPKVEGILKFYRNSKNIIRVKSNKEIEMLLTSLKF